MDREPWLLMDDTWNEPDYDGRDEYLIDSVPTLRTVLEEHRARRWPHGLSLHTPLGFQLNIYLGRRWMALYAYPHDQSGREPNLVYLPAEVTAPGPVRFAVSGQPFILSPAVLAGTDLGIDLVCQLYATGRLPDGFVRNTSQGSTEALPGYVGEPEWLLADVTEPKLTYDGRGELLVESVEVLRQALAEHRSRRDPHGVWLHAPMGFTLRIYLGGWHWLAVSAFQHDRYLAGPDLVYQPADREAPGPVRFTVLGRPLELSPAVLVQARVGIELVCRVYANGRLPQGFVPDVGQAGAEEPRPYVANPPTPGADQPDGSPAG